MNNTGKKYGGRKKGTPNKLTSEVKEKIRLLVESALESIDLSECTRAERIRLLEIGLKYILPTVKQIESSSETEFQSIDFNKIIRYKD